MKIFFWGFFSKPWKRLFRTFSSIIILIYLVNLIFNSSDDEVIIPLTIIVISIPILSYIIEPFVTKISKNEIDNNRKEFDSKIENEIIIEKESTLENKIIEKRSKYSSIVNSFTFKKEYISGNVYFLRIFIGHFLIIFFGIGLILIVTSVYKRSLSLGFSKTNSIIMCVLIPILIFTSSIISVVELTPENYIVNQYRFYFFTITIYILLSPHIYIWFKNGMKSKLLN